MPGSTLSARVAFNFRLYLLCLAFLASAIPSPDHIHVSLRDATTCPFRTINYITQTLPQQCLKTSWSNHATITGRASIPPSQLETPKIGSLSLISLKSGENDGFQNDTEILETTSTAPPESFQAVAPSLSIAASTPNPTDHQAETTGDAENDPLSDSVQFLSFEDWKAQMLKKAGQSPDHVGNSHVDKGFRRRPSSINDALDSLGDDSEIELDFSGFVNSNTEAGAFPPRILESTTSDGVEERGTIDDTPSTRRSKDAGKTCKERSNYASFDCAATVLKTNPECKGSTSVLVENKDSYMLNECSAKNKFFIVELCNDILIDTIVLGNFEFFSSTFRTFRVSVSDQYPVKLEKWKELGTFQARNSRDVQAFLVENPLIWARYLRIEFLTHYGNEYYCPISLLRVHGKTMMDDYRNEVKAIKGEEELDDDTLEIERKRINGKLSDEKVDGEKFSDVTITNVASEGINVATTQPEADNASNISNNILESNTLEKSGTDSSIVVGKALLDPSSDKTRRITHYGPLLEQYELISMHCSSDRSSCNMESTELIRTANRPRYPIARRGAATNNQSLSLPPSSSNDQFLVQNNSATPSSYTSLASATQPTQTRSSDVQKGGIHNMNNTSATPSVKGHSNNTHTPPSKVSHHPPIASPTTQESFFKSMHKRLQLLEANSTLSLQYIEEQSRLLREAFAKVEKRQIVKTTAFLENLNRTVLDELKEIRLQYDQIWQSTVLELSSQREQSQHDMVALSARMSILADEVLFQKRMAILQFVLILICLGLVIFSPRTSPSSGTAYIELPAAVQNMVARPTTSFSRYLHLDSPPGTPPRPGSRYGLFSRAVNHLRSPSDGTTYEDDPRKSSGTEYRPPTPLSIGSDGEDPILLSVDSRQNVQSEEGLRRIVSSPAIASGQRIILESTLSTNSTDMNSRKFELEAEHQAEITLVEKPGNNFHSYSKYHTTRSTHSSNLNEPLLANDHVDEVDTASNNGTVKGSSHKKAVGP